MFIRCGLIFCYCLLVAAMGVAQSVGTCGTTAEEQFTTPDFVRSLLRSPDNTPRLREEVEVPIKLHFITARNGALGADSAAIFRELGLVNEAYAPAGIRFVSCGPINYIRNNRYLTFVKRDDEILCDENDVAGALNIYFCPNLERQDGSSLCGYAYNFDIRQRLFMDNGCARNGSTLTHELGHSFSLLHTHSSSNGAELVDGTNCSSAGDLICDTPADPELDSDNVDNDCNYTGTTLDDRAQPYEPATDNFMSYSRKACRDVFTDGQLARIEAYFLREGAVLDCLDGATSISDLSTPSPRIYPNPFRGEVFLSDLPAKVQLRLLRPDGKVVWQQFREQAGENLRLQLPEQLPAGAYYLTLTGPGKTTSQLLIKK